MTTIAGRIRRLISSDEAIPEISQAIRPSGGMRYTNIPFELTENERVDGRVLLASGNRTRNRDFWTGKVIRIDPNGVRLDSWRKNNLVVYMHNMSIPLATAEAELIDGMLWGSNLKFHRKKIPIAGWEIGEFDTSVIADLWEEGFLNATSIHVIFTPEDEKNIVETEEEIFFPTSELIEWSIVTVGADREAVRQELSDRGVCSGITQCLLPPPAETPGREVTMSEEVVEQVVEEEEVIEPETIEDEPVEEVEEDVEMVLDVTEVAQAIAASPEALLILAQALAGSESVRALFAPEPAESPQQRQQRFVLKLVADQAATEVQEQRSIPEPTPVQQAKSVERQNGKKSVRDAALLGLVR